MGYYTRHELHVFETEEPVEKFEHEISEIAYGKNTEYSLFDEETKWYDHDEHMKKISEKYPEVLFELTGYGEEQLDIWRTYYKNGKSQPVDVTITFGAFNEAELKGDVKN
jgi:hypothetical protein